MRREREGTSGPVTPSMGSGTSPAISLVFWGAEPRAEFEFPLPPDCSKSLAGGGAECPDCARVRYAAGDLGGDEAMVYRTPRSQSGQGRNSLTDDLRVANRREKNVHEV